LPRTGTVVVEADAPAYLPTQLQMNSERDGKPQPLVLRAAGSITGRVLDETGKPVSGVTVVAGRQKGEPSLGMFMGWTSPPTTGDDGTYEITRLAPGVYNVVLLDNGGRIAPWPTTNTEGKSLSKRVRVAQAIEAVQVTARTKTPVRDIRIVTPSFVEGTVVDAQTGAPLKGVHVGVYGPHAPRSSGLDSSAASQENGRFRVAVMPGVNRIFAYRYDPVGHHERLDKDEVLSRQHLTLKAGETRRVTLRLPPSPVLRGVAVDEAGKPVAGAEMVVGTAPGSGRYVYTRADGSFEMKGLSAGHVYLSTGGDFSNRDWRLISKASTTQPGPDRGSIKVALPQREPLKIILRRLQCVTASGRVVTTAGNPVAEALVRVKVQARADDKWSSYTVRKVTTDA
jgi:protocatechuate 3,4-dioxygenase beta subunit